MVIYGRPGDVSNRAALLAGSTLAEGGSVLIAADAALDLAAYLPDGKASITGVSVTSDDGEDCLGGRRFFPLVRTAGGWPEASSKPFTIATNEPSALQDREAPKYLGGARIRFPDSAQTFNRGLHRNEVFAASGTGPGRNPFRCLVVADQDVFSNALLYASASDFGGVTPDNFRFAFEVVKWLAADGTRKKCVFIENGSVKERFDDFDFTAIPDTPPALPPDVPMPPIPNPLDRPVQEMLANLIDGGIAKFEDDNPLTRSLARNDRVTGTVLAALLGVGVSILLSIFVRRLWQGRHRPEYQPLPADPLMLGDGAAHGSFEHRRLELLRGGDFRGPVVAYLRRMFGERGLPSEADGRVPPPLDIRGRNRSDLKAMIRELWEEAFVFDRAPLPYTRWKEIERPLAAVRSAADADLWRFRPAGG